MRDFDREQWNAVCILIAFVLVMLVGAKVGEYAKRHPAIIESQRPVSLFATTATAAAATYPATVSAAGAEPINCASSVITFTIDGIRIDSASCKQGIFTSGFEVTK